MWVFCSTGRILVLLNTVSVISAVTKCYPVNDQEYCFYTDDSVLNWTKAREFCRSLNSTLPIITDEDIDNVFQQFIVENIEVSGSDTNHVNNSVWLDAHANHVNDSVKWHWINSHASGLYRTKFCLLKKLIWSHLAYFSTGTCRLAYF